MRGLGVLEDGFVFTELELERGTPRFWWGLRKRTAYDRALARRGIARRDRDEEEQDGIWSDSDDATVAIGAGAAAAAVMMQEDEKKTESSGSWWSGWGGGGDSGGASDSGSSDSGGGRSSDSGSSDSGGSSND